MPDSAESLTGGWWDGTPAQTGERLSAQLRRTDLARHIACFNDSPESQLSVAASFVKTGLEGGNRILYFADANTPSAVETALESAGVDVDTRLAAGDLILRRGTEAYEEASFDPDRLITLLEEACHESVAEEYEGLWVVGEVSWCFHTDLDYDHVVDFEAGFDAVCPDLPIVALCQYDLTQFNDESVAKALWTHEQIIYRHTVCENPFYVPPETFQSAETQPTNTRLMLEQAYRLAEAAQEIERREQRLDVVDRILRHDVRNHLNVTRGILDLLREVETLEGEHAAQLATATDAVDHVFETANKARHVQRTLDDSGITCRRLGAVLDNTVARVVAGHPESTITVTGDEDVAVTADRNLGIALTELVLFALRTQDDAGTIGLDVVTHDETVCLSLSYPGPPVSENDRRVLEVGEETPLNHCTGLGLWLVKWIVENADGSVEFPSDGEEPIRVFLERSPN